MRARAIMRTAAVRAPARAVAAALLVIAAAGPPGGAADVPAAPCLHPTALRLGRETWVRRYRELNRRTYDGTGYVHKGGNYSTWLGWNENRVLSSYLVMYEVTGETSWLDTAVSHIDVILSRAVDANGDGLSLWLEKEGQEARCDYETSQIAAPIARFGRLVLQRPELRERYGDSARRSLEFVERNVIPSFERFYGQRWGEFAGGRGVLCSEHTDPKTGRRVRMSRHPNQIASKACIYLDVGAAAGNPAYLDRATKMARFLKGGMQLVDGGTDREAYHWHYHMIGGEWDIWTPNEWCAEGPEDIGHANSEIGFLVKAHRELGVPDERDVRRLVGTVLHLQWNGDPDEPYLHQYMEKGKTWNATGEIWDYVVLAQFDGRLLGLFETILDNVYREPDHYSRLKGDAGPAEPGGVLLGIARLLEAARRGADEGRRGAGAETPGGD